MSNRIDKKALITLFPPEISFDLCAPTPPPPSFATAVVWLLAFLLGGWVAVVTYLAIGALYTVLTGREQRITIRSAMVDSMIAAVVASIGSGLLEAGLLALVRYVEHNEHVRSVTFHASRITMHICLFGLSLVGTAAGWVATQEANN